MATEFKLSYTGSEINEKLGKIDSLATNSDISELQTVLDNKADKSQGIFYIEGDSSSTTDTGNKVATWIGSHDEITEYFNGLTILYKVVTAGSTSTTLNINGLGATTVVRNATTGISTACPVNGVLLLTYTVDSDGTAYWKTADYDSNTKNSAGTSNKTGSKMYLVGATSQTSSGTTTYTNSNIYINTSNVLYSAKGFSGSLTGNADTATKATQDASGNVITSTYETKENATTNYDDLRGQINQLSSEKVDRSDLEIIKDEIRLAVIDSFGGNPVFGYVDSNNNIILSGTLASASYTVKYEMEDGSVVNIGDLVFEESYNGYDVYAEFGYTNNSRISYSGKAIQTEQSGYVLSGAVPMKNLVGKTVTIRTTGLTNAGGKGIWGIFESADATTCVVNGNISDNTLWNGIQKSYDDSGSVIVSTFVFPENYANYYFRYSSSGSGEGAVMTIDKVIPSYTNLVPTAKGTDGNVLNGVGYQRDARWSSSSGSLNTTATGYTAIGCIDITAGEPLTVYVYGLDFDGTSNCALVTTSGLGTGVKKFSNTIKAGFTGTTFVTSVEKLGDYYYKITTLATDSGTKYMELCGKTVSSITPIVTLNEPITDCDSTEPELATFTNLFDPSTAILNNRVNSSGGFTEVNGAIVTGFINISNYVPFTDDTKIYIRGANFEVYTDDGTPRGWIRTFKTSSNGYLNSYSEAVKNAMTITDEGNGVISVSIDKVGAPSDVKYMVCQMRAKDTAITYDDIKDIIVTINEPIYK